MERTQLADGLDEDLLARAGRTGRLELTIEVTDPEVVAELRRHAPGGPREGFAAAALRLGVLSLRMASGQVDAGAIREAGQRLVGEVRELLSARAAELTGQLAGTLGQYFDPQSGLVPQRLQALVQKDGELERVLRAHLGPDESLLARTLAGHLGAGSPIFRMLSPTESEGLVAQLAETLEAALREQSEHVLKEFTLDQPGSALSRLVDKIEATRRSISDQFSMDNEASALSRMSKLLQATSEQIGKSLTLDDERSTLSRLKRELTKSIDELVKRNGDFHLEVRATLASLKAQREEAARSTRHGAAFEEQLGATLAAEAQRLGDVHQATGATTGAIRNCKTGDHVVALGPESPAPGAQVVWEAKEDRSYDLKKALAEMEEARKNRQAQLGVFVFSKQTAPADLAPFGRYGADLVVVWDGEDPATDVYVKAAYSVARALAIRVKTEAAHTAEAVQEIELATRAVEKQLNWLDELKRMAETVKGHGEKILDRAVRMRADLAKEVERLDRQIGALKAEG